MHLFILQYQFEFKILNRSESASESSMITVISANKDSNSNIFLTPPTSVHIFCYLNNSYNSFIATSTIGFTLC